MCQQAWPGVFRTYLEACLPQLLVQLSDGRKTSRYLWVLVAGAQLGHWQVLKPGQAHRHAKTTPVIHTYTVLKNGVLVGDVHVMQKRPPLAMVAS